MSASVARQLRRIHEQRIRERDSRIIERDIGTCQTCGRYGYAGKVCVRNGEECGEYM